MSVPVCCSLQPQYVYPSSYLTAALAAAAARPLSLPATAALLHQPHHAAPADFGPSAYSAVTASPHFQLQGAAAGGDAGSTTIPFSSAHSAATGGGAGGSASAYQYVVSPYSFGQLHQHSAAAALHLQAAAAGGMNY